jgi:bifunctional oligoribonuclease and PAP phosphatase NrnA
MEQSIDKFLTEIANNISSSSKVVIFSHINPDGDAIGSSLGLYHYLKDRVGEVQVIMPNRFPDFLKFLPGSDKILIFDRETKKASEIISNADFLFFLDFNDIKRIEKMGEIAASSKGLKIMIDHHPEPELFAAFSISDTEVCSTSELIFEFISKIENGNFLNADFANCLMAGIITDTGLFNHNSERRRTFEIVASLLDMGADKEKIIQKIYNEYPYHRMQLLGNALHNRLMVYPEFGTAFIYLPKDDLLKYNHQIGDTEGFVNIPLSISGIKFSAIFIEKDDQVKCSFRSTGTFDVNEFARKYFNGGGHLKASGGRSFDSLNKTIEIFVQLIEKHKNEILKNS